MRFFFFFLLSFFSFMGYAQASLSFWEPAPEYHKTRSNLLIYGGGGAAVASLSGLYFAWYSDYDGSGFHVVNDGGNWLGMDKVGHITTSYFVGEMGYYGFKWAGHSERTAIWAGGLTGFSYLTIVELMDGLSEGWGYSWHDMAANTLGAAFFIGQQIGFKEQRIRLKWSYSATDYPQYRPDLLGDHWSNYWLKDYNGQTYWLSVNPNSFGLDWFPRWLNIAGGYGADGMVGAAFNPTEYNGTPLPEFERRRQYYLSLDLDLSRIKTKSKVLKSLFRVVNFVKIPAPTLEINEGGDIQFYPLYF